MTRLLHAAGWMACGLLVACVTPPRPAAEQTWAGRFSVTATTGESRDSVSGRFLLERRGDRLALELSAPIGGTVARIETSPSGARARGMQIAETSGPDADSLAEQMLGFRLPVRGLPYWIEGRAMPDAPALIEPAADGGERIAQDDWTIQVLDRNGRGAPRRLLIERGAVAGAPAVKLRLVIDPTP